MEEKKTYITSDFAYYISYIDVINHIEHRLDRALESGYKNACMYKIGSCIVLKPEEFDNLVINLANQIERNVKPSDLTFELDNII